jgi:thioredoxin reductase (NADPH)
MQHRAVTHPKIKMEWNRALHEVFGNDDDGVTSVLIKSTVDSKEEKFDVGGVFIAIGHTPNTDFLDGQLKLDSKKYVELTVPFRTNTSVEGVFAAGDVADSNYRQACTAAGTGCMAAIDAERWLAEHGHH